MPRRLRIEFSGACYHVVNRGNYRNPVFDTVGAAEAFLATLREAVERYGWLLYAFTLMKNHFHLVLQTPQPNLVDGMHWLQSTFSTRFNRFRKEQGHVFQGRYFSGLLEDESAIADVVDYVHINPVRAGIIPVERLRDFRWSSFRYFRKDQSFPGLTAAARLRMLLPGEGTDMDQYEMYLT